MHFIFLRTSCICKNQRFTLFFSCYFRSKKQSAINSERLHYEPFLQPTIMQKVFFFLALFITIHLSAQDIIYTISAKQEDRIISLDSILIENKRNDSRLLVDSLGSKNEYTIILSSYEVFTSLSDNTEESAITMIKNHAGEITVSCNRSAYGDAQLSVHHLSGKQVYAQKIHLSDQNNTFTIAIPYSGVYLLHIQNATEGACFKVLGNNVGGEISVTPTLTSTHKNIAYKTAHLAQISDFSFLMGDSLRITAFKDSMASTPLELSILNSDTLLFGFDTTVLIPMPIYWDPTAQPEMMALTDIYKDEVETVYFAQGELENIQWGGDNTSVAYWAGTYPIQNDALELYLRPNVIPWAEFKLPRLIKGKYKMWVAYRANPYGQGIKVSFLQGSGFSPQYLEDTLQIGEYGRTPSQISEDDLESTGFKWYTNTPETNRTVCKLLGIINVNSTGEHLLKMEALTNSRGRLWLDMIQFIPIDMDQRWPKFDHDGNFVYETDTQTN